MKIAFPPKKTAWAVLFTLLFQTSAGAVQVPSGESTPSEEPAEQVQAPKEEPVKHIQASKEELERLEKEILFYPKKDWFFFGGDFDYLYDTNMDHLPIHHEEGDSIFRLKPFAQINLSGRQTDFRLEWLGLWEYRVKRQAGDPRRLEGRLRASRKITPKLLFSINDRLSRDSTRVENRDDRQIRWDNFHQQALTYYLTPKLTLNLETVYSRSDFPHELDNQSETSEFRLDPTVFYQITPKSRILLGYGWGFLTGRDETSDSTRHLVRGSYLGVLTPKSSYSLNVQYLHEDPDSASASKRDRVDSSIRYIFQIRPKLSLRFAYAHVFENTTTNAVGSVYLQTRDYLNSDTVSLSALFRATRKIALELAFDPTHTRNHTFTLGDKTAERRLFLFPVQVALTYQLIRWVRLRLSYIFTYQVGDERKLDEFRAHTWFVTANVAV